MEKRNEFRSIRLETRVDEKQEGGKKLVLRGYPILFNTETKIFDCHIPVAPIDQRWQELCPYRSTCKKLLI